MKINIDYKKQLFSKWKTSESSLMAKSSLTIQKQAHRELPHITVATIIQREGRFLMVEEMMDEQIYFNQPAGHLESDESLAEAAIRETLEETGWHIKLTALVGVYLNKNPLTNITYQRVAFAAECLQHDANYTLDQEIIATHWLTRMQILTLPASQLRSPLVISCIDDFLNDKRYPLEILHHVK